MYQIKVGEHSFQLNPKAKQPNAGTIDGSDYQLDLQNDGGEIHLLHNNKSYNLSVVSADYEQKSFRIRVNNNEYELEAKDRFDLLLEELGMEDLAGAAVNDLKAPMPGMVLSIAVEEGQSVAKGEPLVVLEAMKMENVLKAESDATVKAIHATEGKAVEKNQVLVEFEA